MLRFHLKTKFRKLNESLKSIKNQKIKKNVLKIWNQKYYLKTTSKLKNNKAIEFYYSKMLESTFFSLKKYMERKIYVKVEFRFYNFK